MSAPGGTHEVPDLRYSDTEEELRSAVRALLTDRCPPSAVLARLAGGEPGGQGVRSEPADAGLWRTLAADLGCAGLLIPERHGGAGASFREAAVVAEETGRAVAPVPYLGSAVVATAALLALLPETGVTGTEPPGGGPAGGGPAAGGPAAGGAAALLAELASGQRTAALLVEFDLAPPAANPGDLATRAGVTGDPHTGVRVTGPAADGPPGGVRLSGRVEGVVDALAAGILLVPGDGVPFGFYAVDATAAGVTMDRLVSLDETRPLATVTLDGATGLPVAAAAAATRAVGAGLTAGAAMLASELLGVGEACLEMTLAYVRERRQFGRPVGSFQAVKHRLADVWVQLTQARAAARYAAACLAEPDPDAAVAVALAKAACGDAAVHAAQECVQLHGGIGFTWEHPAHLYLKRATAASLAFGSADRHRAALARLVELNPPG